MFNGIYIRLSDCPIVRPTVATDVRTLLFIDKFYQVNQSFVDINHFLLIYSINVLFVSLLFIDKFYQVIQSFVDINHFLLIYC